MNTEASAQYTMLLAELQQRWQAAFAALARGDDLAPGRRYRMEGMMESAALLEPGSEADISEAMAAAYLRQFGNNLAQDFGQDWQQFYPFPQIPAVMKRAPVYPSTTD
ncbi:MAG: hypothetical protein ABJK20_03940 [Halieaceae bacterium]